MSHRYRLYPTPDQEPMLRVHVGQARFVWNLALEHSEMHRSFGRYADMGKWHLLLTEARKAEPWLAAGSSSVQHTALRDLHQAFRNWWTNPGHFRHPTRRKRGVSEGFCIRDLSVRRLNRKWATVHVPKIGPVRFRLSRPLPAGAKSARATLDRSGRWHVSFTAIPAQVEGPGDGSIVGVDRGIAIDYQCSDGRRWDVPSPDTRRIGGLQRKMARQQKGSKNRARTKHRIAKLRAREVDRRRDAIEKATTELARTADVVRIENLRVHQMMRSAKGTLEEPGVNVAAKSGLNRSIAETGWSTFARRLEDKIGARLERVPATYTSQRCHKCGHTAAENRDGQSRFECRACGHTDNADVNAAKNVAAGRAVSACGGTELSGPPGEARTDLDRRGVSQHRNRGIPGPQAGEDVNASSEETP